jgi:hypothetical protein
VRWVGKRSERAVDVDSEPESELDELFRGYFEFRIVLEQERKGKEGTN